MSIVWIVSELLPPEHPSGHTWQIIGAFTDQEKAKAECKTENYFYGPVTLDEAIHGEPIPWPTCRFPHRDLAEGEESNEVSEARYQG